MLGVPLHEVIIVYLKLKFNKESCIFFFFLATLELRREQFSNSLRAYGLKYRL